MEVREGMNILFLTTGSGRNKFAKSLCKEAYRLGHKGYTYYCTSIDLAFSNHPEWTPQNLIIHPRAANPGAWWMQRLEELEGKGYKVINSTKVLRLTSDKWESIKILSGIGNIPQTYLYDKDLDEFRDIYGDILNAHDVWFLLDEDYSEMVLKPRISQGQGKHVIRLSIDHLEDGTFKQEAKKIPGRLIIVQGFLTVHSIYRVFCFNGNSAKMVTVDFPSEDNWKVSVCLNKNQNVDGADENKDIVEFAEEIQRKIGGKVNFIDVFWTDNGAALSEVNTACNLSIHTKLTGLNLSKMIVEALL